METGPATHELKTWTKVFQEMWDDNKLFEYRYNDRDYRKGDKLVLREYDPATEEYTGRVIECTVTFMLYGKPDSVFGVPVNYVIMSIRKEKQIDNDERKTETIYWRPKKCITYT